MHDGDFGRHLAELRLIRGLTQADLAERTGLSARCVSDLERGLNAAPRLSTLHMLADGLELDPDEKRRLLEVAACARIQVRFGNTGTTRANGRGRRLVMTG